MRRSRRPVWGEHDNHPGSPSGAPLEAVCVRLLGGFRVSVGNRTVQEGRWRLRKAAGLLKLLALTPGHRLHRERAMDLLWPKLGAKAASNNLRYALHHARKTLEPADESLACRCYLPLRSEQLVLCPEGYLWVDVEAFEEAAAAARRAREPAAYRAALDLYTGDLLPGDLYEEWAQGPREKLRNTYLDLLLELAVLYEGHGDFRMAVQALQQTVDEERTHEGAHAGLMRLYALSGRRREALRQYEKLEETLRRELGAQPDAESMRLHEEILSGRFPSDQRSLEDYPSEEGSGIGLHNLPTARDSFVGRKHEELEIKRLLTMTNLLTLTGAGGSGKTRLALEVARELIVTYPDGVWLTELAPLSEPRLVPQTVAGALGVREQPNRPLLDALVEHLRAKRALLVLDNCEHLVDAVARLADMLLSFCPRLKILVTSREPLGVAGEANWRVPPLSVPNTDHFLPAAEDFMRYEAVTLFVDRARSRLPAFELTPENAQAVVEVCRRLDGIPLAIELATARVTVLAVEQLAERLEDSLGLLAAGPRMAAPRHRTMRAALEWSYDLLEESEKMLFRRLSVFAGGWNLEAAEAVGSGDRIEEEDVLDLLGKLVDKSLVVAEAGADGTRRYRMLEPVRQHARERLEESEEAKVATRRRHAAFFLGLAEDAEPELKGPDQEKWLTRLEREHENFRAALSGALERREAELAMRLVRALGEFWYTRGHVDEGQQWLQAALANSGSLPAFMRIKALAWAAYIAWEQGDYDRSTALGEEGLALSRNLGDQSGVAAALHGLGTVALHRNECEKASEMLEEALALRRALGDTMGVGRVLQALGLVAVARQDYNTAIELHEEGLPLAREMKDKLGTTLLLGQGALAHLGLGDYEQARTLCAEGLELSKQLRHRHTLIHTLHIAAVLAVSQGEPLQSARLWEAAEALRRSIGATLSALSRYVYGPYIATARARAGEATWEAASAEGRAMTPEQAVKYALSEEEPAPPAVPTVPEEPLVGTVASKLARREREVAGLVARGLTNRQIASKLSISEHTVANHVAKILHKLSLGSRSQITAWVLGQRSFT